MQLRQSQNGYRYTTDSILLYRFAAQKRLRGRLLDVGCGCGIVGLLLARDFGVELTGVDIQQEMIDFCMQNSALNGIRAEFITQDFRDYKSDYKFDTIICNPPFYNARTTPSENRSLQYARYASALPIDDLLKNAGRLISSNGDLFFCYDANAFYTVVQILSAQKYSLKAVCFVHTMITLNARLVLIWAKKSRVKAVTILPPIITQSANVKSDFMQNATKKAATKCVA